MASHPITGRPMFDGPHGQPDQSSELSELKERLMQLESRVMDLELKNSEPADLNEMIQTSIDKLIEVDENDE